MLLFFWLLWGAFGSITFRRGNADWAIVLLAALGTLVPLMVRITAIPLRPVFGMTTPFWSILIAGFFCSSPIFFGGRVFASLANVFSPARLYAAEGIGALIGGMLSIIALTILPPTTSVIVLSFIAITPLILRVPQKFVILFLMLAISYFASWLLKSAIDLRLWRGFDTEEVESPYGRIVLMERAGENYIFENGRLMASSGDSLSVEQVVHPIMWAHKEPKRVLVIGGVFSGAVRDVQKHHADRIIVPFPDQPLLLSGISSLPALRDAIKDANVEFVACEARKILAEGKKFDVIISMPGFPTSGADNRFWTMEFFAEMRNALNREGIAAAALPVGANMLSKYQSELVASVWKTFQKVFPNGEIYFLDGVVLLVSADSGKLNLRDKLLSGELRSVSAATLPIGYLPMLFQPQRAQTLRRQLSAAKFTAVNRDWRPLAYLWGMLEQAALADITIPAGIARGGTMLMITAVIILCIVLFVAVMFPKKSPILLVCVGGFWGMASQSLFLLLFQANFGNLYWLIGAAVGVFLSGSAAGSILGERLSRRTAPITLMMIFITVVAIVFSGMSGASIPMVGFFVLFALSGAICGLAFGISSSGNIAGGIIYGSDLIGAAAGAIVAIFTIPTMAPIAIIIPIGVALLILSVITMRK